MPSSRPDPADKLVDRLFADALPKSPDSGPVPTDLSDELITSEFQNPIATGAPPAPSPADDLRDPRPAPSQAASPPSLDPVLKAPSQFPAPPNAVESTLSKPTKPVALIVSLVILLALCAAAFYLL
jgi:hypothetical protein